MPAQQLAQIFLNCKARKQLPVSKSELFVYCKRCDLHVYLLTLAVNNSRSSFWSLEDMKVKAKYSDGRIEKHEYHADPRRQMRTYTAESSPACSINSGSGICSAAGIQFRNRIYVDRSALTNLEKPAPVCLGVLLVPLRYHFGKYTRSLIGCILRSANARRKPKADNMFIPAATPMSLREPISLQRDSVQNMGHGKVVNCKDKYLQRK